MAPKKHGKDATALRAINVSLAQLKPSKEVTEMIERWCCCIQDLSVKATMLANQCIVDDKLTPGEASMYFGNVSWWEHHMKIWTTLSGCEYAELLTRGRDALMARKSFELLCVKNMTEVINFAATQMKTMASNMLASRYMPTVKSSFRRDIILLMRQGLLHMTSVERHAFEKYCMDRFKEVAFPGMASKTSSPSSADGNAKKTAAIEKASTMRPHYERVIAKWKAAVPQYFEWCQQRALIQGHVDKFKDDLLTTGKYDKLKELKLIKSKDLTEEQKREKGVLNKELNKEVSIHRRSLSEKIDKDEYYCRLLFMKHLHATKREDGDRMRALDDASSSLHKISKDTKKAFWNSCKAGLLLPLCGYDVKSIRLDARGLQSLLSEVKTEEKARNPLTTEKKRASSSANIRNPKRPKCRDTEVVEEEIVDAVSDKEDFEETIIAEEDGEVKPDGSASSSRGAPKAKPARRVPSAEESAVAASKQRALFVKTFPGLKTLLSRAKSDKGDNLLDQLGKSLCTNGICASVFLQIPKPDVVKSDSVDAADYFNRRKDYDLESKCPPQKIRPGERMVSIDPGRRDMIVAYEAGSEKHLVVSTAHHIRKSWRSATTACTLREQRKVLLTECDFQRYVGRLDDDKKALALIRRDRGNPLDMAEYLSKCPTKDCDVASWSTYVDYVWPVISERLEAFRNKSIRRAKFKSYSRVDKSLDDICKKICQLGAPESELTRQFHHRDHRNQRTFHGENVLVAFGNGCGTSTGFGYAPAPQARLRHRLETVHKCRVTLIHEFCTSKLCSSCEKQMVYIGEKTMAEHISALEQKKMNVNVGVTKRPIHGVLKCLECNKSGAQSKVGPRKHWHRDVNAAINIGKIYTCLAETGNRPDYLKLPGNDGEN
jgi:hypothetical protein